MFIFDYLVKSSLLMLLFLGFSFLLRNYAATVRYSLWRLAFVLLALLPLAVLLMPVTNVPLLPAAQELTQDAEASRIYRPPAELRTDYQSIGSAATENSGIEGSPAETAGTPAFGLLNFTHYFDWIWPAGGLLILLAILSGNFHILRLKNNGSSISQPDVSQALSDFKSSLKLSREVKIFSSERIDVPITCGWLRPVILFPADFRGWTPRQVDLNLLHELEHIKRNDYAWNLFVNIACALFWFNPLVWIAAALYRAEREKSIDERIVERGIKPSEYAHHLVEAASRFLHAGRLMRSQLAVSKISSLKQRVLAILSSSIGRKTMPRWFGVAAAALLCCAALPLASLSFWSTAGSPDLTTDDPRDTQTFEGLPQPVIDFKTAYNHIEKEEFEQAGSLLESLIRDFPYLGSAKLNLAGLYIHQGRHDLARKLIYEVLLLQHEQEINCARLLALSYADVADSDRTLHWLARMIKIKDPDSAQIKQDEKFAKVSDDVKFQLLLSLISNEEWRRLETTFIKPEFDAEVRGTLPAPPSRPVDISHLAYTAKYDPDHLNRIMAVTLLGGLGTAEALDAIAEALKTEFDPDVIEYGLYAIAGVPRDDIADRLLKLCEGDNTWVLAFGGWMIGKFAPEKAVDILIRATFTDIDHECHEDAVYFLSRLPGNKGAEALRYLAEKHPSESIRQYAKEKLEFITKTESN